MTRKWSSRALLRRRGSVQYGCVSLQSKPPCQGVHATTAPSCNFAAFFLCNTTYVVRSAIRNSNNKANVYSPDTDYFLPPFKKSLEPKFRSHTPFLAAFNENNLPPFFLVEFSNQGQLANVRAGYCPMSSRARCSDQCSSPLWRQCANVLKRRSCSGDTCPS